MKTVCFALLLPLSAVAGIYGRDSRVESQQEGDSRMIELARSVPALVQPVSLAALPNGDYRLVDFRATREFCSDARFFGQPSFSGCSASLIADDLVLTAAHCLTGPAEDPCGGAKVVFDFALGKDTEVIRKENVFECERVEYREFNTRAPGEDLAIIKLKRRVEGRPWIRLAAREPRVGDKLSMIGYPLGLPQKTVTEGKLQRHDFSLYSFRHNLDTFSSNSGGPIFDEDLKQVGVLVRSTSQNWSQEDGRTCRQWGIARPGDYAEGNTLVHLDAILRELGVRLHRR